MCVFCNYTFQFKHHLKHHRKSHFESSSHKRCSLYCSRIANEKQIALSWKYWPHFTTNYKRTYVEMSVHSPQGTEMWARVSLHFPSSQQEYDYTLPVRYKTYPPRTLSSHLSPRDKSDSQTSFTGT